MRKLYRNKRDYKIAGVCSGLGDYFKIDPVIVRLFFIALFIGMGFGIILYIIGWIIIPIEE